MKRSSETKRANKPKTSLCSELDTHNWATKMEVHHLLTGKPDLQLKGPDRATR
ncbi:MAG: hypothetical protein ACYTEL_19680 [Planctomycetota bacterium]